MAEAAEHQGTAPSAARRWLRRTGAVLAAVPLVAGAAAPSEAQAARTEAQTQARPAQAQGQARTAQAQTQTQTAGVSTTAQSVSSRAPRSLPQASGSRSVSVSVDSLTPSAPTADDTVTVTGSLTNRSSRTIREGGVRLYLGSPLGGRSAIDSAARRDGYSPGLEGSPVDGKYTAEVRDLAPGGTGRFRLSVPVEDLGLDEAGVYQLGVALSGETAAQPYEQVLGIEHTFLPWQPGGGEAATKTAVMWPLISGSHLTAETGSDESQTPVLEDDTLAREIAPGGRLQQMVSLGSDLDVTWVIDPDLLASVDAMTQGYLVREEDGTTSPGKDQVLANQWLNELQKAVDGKDVVALPYADPDLASLAHTGNAVPGSLSHLKNATDAAVKTVETVLHVKPSTDFAWPVAGAVDPSIVDVATSAGARTVVTRSDTMTDPGLSYTPTAPRPIGGDTTALVADSRLSTAFQGDMLDAENSTLAVQQFLAQSLMIARQTPGKDRSLVVAPQRTPTAAQAQSLAAAVRSMQDAGWTGPQSLKEAAASTPDPAAGTRVPSAGSYPESLRRQELPRSAFEEIRVTRARLDGFQVILTDASRVVTPFGRAMDREMSASWRGRATEASRFRDGVGAYLNLLTRQVSLIQKSEAKLSGRSATIPVTVQNNLVQGVDNLVLRLTSSKPTRLKIGDASFAEEQVQVSGGHAQSIKFDTIAEANGPVEVVAQLYTEDGRPYGQPTRFNVNVTEVTPTVMLVLAGGVLLLVLAGFRMYTQRKRSARAADDAAGAAGGDTGDGPDGGPRDGSSGDGPGDGSGGDGGHGSDGDGDAPSSSPAPDATPEQPGDAGPDTSPESQGPATPGERVDR